MKRLGIWGICNWIVPICLMVFLSWIRRWVIRHVKPKNFCQILGWAFSFAFVHCVNSQIFSGAPESTDIVLAHTEGRGNRLRRWLAGGTLSTCFHNVLPRRGLINVLVGLEHTRSKFTVQGSQEMKPPLLTKRHFDVKWLWNTKTKEVLKYIRLD